MHSGLLRLFIAKKSQIRMQVESLDREHSNLVDLLTACTSMGNFARVPFGLRPLVMFIRNL